MLVNWPCDNSKSDLLKAWSGFRAWSKLSPGFERNQIMLMRLTAYSQFSYSPYKIYLHYREVEVETTIVCTKILLMHPTITKKNLILQYLFANFAASISNRVTEEESEKCTLLWIDPGNEWIGDRSPWRMVIAINAKVHSLNCENDALPSSPRTTSFEQYCSSRFNSSSKQRVLSKLLRHLWLTFAAEKVKK